MIDIESLVGDPRKVDAELLEFRKTARKLSNDPTIAERFKGKWIGLHSGRIRAHGDRMQDVLDQIDAAGYSRSQAIVRYIHDEPRTLLL